MSDQYYTIHIRVNGGKLTGLEASDNKPCLLADYLSDTIKKFYNK